MKNNTSKTADVASNQMNKLVVFITPPMPYKLNDVVSVLHAKRHELESAIAFGSLPASPLNPTLAPWMG